ncbi:MAG: ESPR-type extended signal peptide-containing protein [Phascolarctobacterium sp.]|nr:ESPR-type extended signal peptide-containing protein [Phascolarctobacterium sp.]
MNHIYKIVWNKVRNCYMVVGEYAKSQTKGCAVAKLFSSKRLAKVAAATLMVVGFGFAGIVNQADAATEGDYVAVRYEGTVGGKGNPVVGSTTQYTDTLGAKYTYTLTQVTVNGQKNYYYVRNGWVLSATAEKRYDGANTDLMLTSYRSDTSTTANLPVFSKSDTTVLGTSTDTVTGKNIITVVDNGYVGAVNTASVTTPYTFKYIMLKDGVWTDVGGGQANIEANAYKVTVSEGVWYANVNGSQVVVDGSNVYNIGGQNYVFKNTDGSIYKGSIFGSNNELLKSTSITTANGTTTNLTVWATDRTDADGEAANLTVGQVNRITDTFTQNDLNLAKADIKEVRVAAGTGNVVNKYTLIRNDEDGTEVANTIVDTDTKVTSVSVTGDATKTVTITSNDGNSVNATFTDNDTKYTAGTNVQISPDNVISATDTNTTNKTMAVSGTTQKTITVTDSDGNTVSANFTDNDTKYTAGSNVQISDNNVISATDTNTTNKTVAVEGTTQKTITITDSDGNNVSTTFTDNDTKYTAGSNVQISDNNVISATDTNTTNKTVAVEGTTQKTITITDSDGNNVSTTFTDNDTKYTAGTNVQISNDNVISATDTNTTNKTVTVSGTTEKTITITDSDGNNVSATFTDNDTKYTAGNNISISEDNVISATDTNTTNKTVTVSGTTEKTITITDSDGNNVSATFTDNDTKYTAGANVQISDDNVISVTDTNTTVDSVTVTGDTNKTITITDSEGNDVTATFTDNNTKNESVTVSGTTEKTITITDSDGKNVSATFTDNDTKYTAGTNVQISDDNVISATDTNTTNQSVAVTGNTEKTITVTDSDGKNVSATFTDNDTKYTAGANVQISDDNVISATDTNTTNQSVAVTGNTEKTITVTDSDGKNVSATFTDNDTKYTAGANVQISDDNVISATDTNTTNTSVSVTGDATKTVTITDSEGKEVTATFTDIDTNTTNTSVSVTGDATKTVTITDSEGNNVTTTFTDNDTTYTQGQGVTIDANNQISANLKEGQNIVLTNNDDGSISINAILSGPGVVNAVDAGWDPVDKHTINIQLSSTDSQGAVSVGDNQVIDNIALSSEVGDIADSNYVNYFGEATTLVEAVDVTMEEALKHTTVVLADGEKNLTITEDINADGGKEYTLSMSRDLDIDNINIGGNTVINNNGITTNVINAGNTTINEGGITTNNLKVNKVTINENGIDAGGQKITNVANATDASDAVNYGQLQAELAKVGNSEAVNQRINQLDNRVNKGLAGAAALAALHPMDFDPDDKLTFAAGYGHYRGENSVALGAFYRPDEKVMFSVGGTLGNGSDMINAGISFSLDRTQRITGSRTAMAKQIVELKAQNADLQAQNVERDNKIANLEAKLASLTELVSKIAK